MSSILGTIGNTPLVRLRALAPANGVDVWVKLEYLNPSGSMKDRMALAMIEGGDHPERVRSRCACADAAVPVRRWHRLQWQ